jgi:hypothetical protein
MIHLSKAHEEHIRELLLSASVARDSLPYSGEFNLLKQKYFDRTFMKLTDAEFWTACVNVAKKGGISGKGNGEPAPKLSSEEKQILERLLPSGKGSRDQLPYTQKLEKLASRFNSATGLSLTLREVWLAILNIAK